MAGPRLAFSNGLKDFKTEIGASRERKTQAISDWTKSLTGL